MPRFNVPSANDAQLAAYAVATVGGIVWKRALWPVLRRAPVGFMATSIIYSYTNQGRRDLVRMTVELGQVGEVFAGSGMIQGVASETVGADFDVPEMWKRDP